MAKRYTNDFGKHFGVEAPQPRTPLPSSQYGTARDGFATLMRLCQEDPDVKAKVRRIVCLPQQKRVVVINQLVQELMLSDAPNDFVMAFTAMLNEDLIAEVCRLVDE